MIPWDKLHGEMTHFPIALLLFSRRAISSPLHLRN
jgi:hypothetical protein